MEDPMGPIWGSTRLLVASRHITGGLESVDLSNRSVLAVLSAVVDVLVDLQWPP